MPVAEVPVWATITIAAVGTGGALVGSIGTALVNRSNLRARLRQELLLHGAHDRTEALEEAIHIASVYRERVAAALRLFDPDQGPGFSDEPLWSWTATAVSDVKTQEESLKLRFGSGEVLTAWQRLEWALAEAAVFSESHRSIADDSHGSISSAVQDKAKFWRAATAQTLKDFSSVAGEALAGVQPPPEPASRFKKLLGG